LPNGQQPAIQHALVDDSAAAERAIGDDDGTAASVSFTISWKLRMPSEYA
jgi:hypothetical protein